MHHTSTSTDRTTLALGEGLSREFLLHHRICPMRRRDDGLIVVAIAPDAAVEALDDIGLAYNATVAVEEVSTDELEKLIERLTSQTDRIVELTRSDCLDTSDTAPLAADEMSDVRDLANQPPVVRFVNLLVRDAYNSGASDIHLEATRSGLSVRFRLDGVLSPSLEPPPNLQHAVVSRIKLLAELDIAERRRPQDGRVRVRLESRELDLRVSTVPTMHGESVVLRLLDRGGRPVDLEDLGMSAELLAAMERLTTRPHGMVLVTGPTGSGKTTTLYACLARRERAVEKIITIEDPIEYQLDGITQVPVHRQAGVGFATALRSILRQDPDVLMIGEMRDQETAEIAVQAAMTGHLVFSTLHTNDAVSAVARLVDLGVPDYLVAATLEGVLAQRLVRRVCDDCREPYSAASDVLAAVVARPVGNATRRTLHRGRGCASCRGTGFKGRIGVFELVLINDELRDAIVRRAPRSVLREISAQRGMASLREDGWIKAQAGLTTVEEVLRVVQE
jgi:general secretion pathway protein E